MKVIFSPCKCTVMAQKKCKHCGKPVNSGSSHYCETKEKLFEADEVVDLLIDVGEVILTSPKRSGEDGIYGGDSFFGKAVSAASDALSDTSDIDFDD